MPEGRLASVKDEQQRRRGAGQDSCICPAERKTAHRHGPRCRSPRYEQPTCPSPLVLASIRSRRGSQALAGSPALRRRCTQRQSPTWPPRGPLLKRNRHERRHLTSASPRERSRQSGRRDDRFSVSWPQCRAIAMATSRNSPTRLQLALDAQAPSGARSCVWSPMPSRGVWPRERESGRANDGCGRSDGAGEERLGSGYRLGLTRIPRAARVGVACASETELGVGGGPVSARLRGLRS